MALNLFGRTNRLNRNHSWTPQHGSGCANAPSPR